MKAKLQTAMAVLVVLIPEVYLTVLCNVGTTSVLPVTPPLTERGERKLRMCDTVSEISKGKGGCNSVRRLLWALVHVNVLIVVVCIVHPHICVNL